MSFVWFTLLINGTIKESTCKLVLFNIFLNVYRFEFFCVKMSQVAVFVVSLRWSCLTDSLYAAIVLATLLLNASVPLYYEMACEVTYPVAEGITNFVLTLVNNIGGLLFLLISMIPHLGKNVNVKKV